MSGGSRAVLDAALVVCLGCGAVFEPSPPPPHCPLCEDERQFVPPKGQRWSTAGELRAGGHRADVRELEPGLTGVGIAPALGVGQRGLLVQTQSGNLLWDPAPLVDEDAVAAVRDRGGVAVVAASHPHMYGAMVEWADLFDAPIALPAVDGPWRVRPTARVSEWIDRLELLGAVTLVQCGGHFPGSAVAHWPAGADGGGVLLTGDTILVAPGEDRVAFLYSAPNRLPLPGPAVRRIADRVAGLPCERIYGGWWSPVIRSGAAEVVQASARRYLEILGGAIA